VRVIPWFKQPDEVLAGALFEHAPIAMLMVDKTGAVRHLNSAAEQLFGYARDELVGGPVEFLLPDSLRAEHVKLREQFLQEPAARPMGGNRSLLARRKDGRLFGVEVGLNPVTVGKESVVIASVLDISARKAAEHRAAIVLRELAHRTKNLLAVIGAMARQVASVSPDIATFEREFGTRLKGLAASHDLLIREEWRGAPIEALVNEQLHFVGPSQSAIHVDGPTLLLSAAACQNFGLGLHELATNAVKHGALSVPTGRIDVRWRVTDEVQPQFEFEWTERDGPSVGTPTRKGFGFVILNQVVPEALGGTAMLDLGVDGAQWLLKAPLDQVIAEDEE
jgi:PAS domain S-box-containing protein